MKKPHTHLFDEKAAKGVRRSLPSKWNPGRPCSQLEFAKLINRSPRSVAEIESGRGAWGYETIKLWAEAAGCAPEDLILVSDVDWQAYPPLARSSERSRMRKAIHLDMAGKHDQAVAICRRLLEEAPVGAYDNAIYSRVLIRMIAYLSNGGHLAQAQAECTSTLQEMPLHMVEERWLVRYHLAVAKRRAGELDAAARLFSELRAERRPGLATAISHQLGVLEIQRAKREPHTRAQHLDTAIEHFQYALAIWAKYQERSSFVPHRIGFSLRRLGEAYELQGRIDDAIRAVLQAAMRLSETKCQRYAREAEQAVLRLIDQRVADASAFPRNPCGGAAGAPASM